MTQIELAKAKDELLDLIERARHGEEVVITEDDKPIIRLVALEKPRKRQFGSAKGMISFADDFDAPLTDFNDYM